MEQARNLGTETVLAFELGSQFAAFRIRVFEADFEFLIGFFAEVGECRLQIAAQLAQFLG